MYTFAITIPIHMSSNKTKLAAGTSSASRTAAAASSAVVEGGRIAKPWMPAFATL